MRKARECLCGWDDLSGDVQKQPGETWINCQSSITRDPTRQETPKSAWL